MNNNYSAFSISFVYPVRHDLAAHRMKRAKKEGEMQSAIEGACLSKCPACRTDRSAMNPPLQVIKEPHYVH